MKTYLDCIPCFFRQALFAARAALDDEEKIKGVLDKIGMLVSEIPLHSSPPETGREIYRIVREVTGVYDPFASLKADSIKKALALYPEMKAMVKMSEDPLETAVRLAIAGNVIDFGANPDFQLERDLQDTTNTKPAINHYEIFREKAAQARNILFLARASSWTAVQNHFLIITAGRISSLARDREITKPFRAKENPYSSS